MAEKHQGIALRVMDGLNSHIVFANRLLDAADSSITRALGIQVSNVALRQLEPIALQYRDASSPAKPQGIVEAGLDQRVTRESWLGAIADYAAGAADPAVESQRLFDVERTISELLDEIAMSAETGGADLPEVIQSALHRRMAHISAEVSLNTALIAEQKAQVAAWEALLSAPNGIDIVKPIAHEALDASQRLLAMLVDKSGQNAVCSGPGGDSARRASERLMAWLDNGVLVDSERVGVDATERKLEAAVMFCADLEILIEEALARRMRLIELRAFERPTEAWVGRLQATLRRIGNLHIQGRDPDVAVLAIAYLTEVLKRFGAHRLVSASPDSEREDLRASIDAAEVSGVFTQSQRAAAHRIRRVADQLLEDQAEDRASTTERVDMDDIFEVHSAVESQLD